MTNSTDMRTLGEAEAELDLVAGGIWRDPYRDRANKNLADKNLDGNTFGGSINNAQFISNPGDQPLPLHGHPIDF